MSVNADAQTSSQGEFSSRVPPSEPLTTKGDQWQHAPGVKVGNDAVREGQTQILPPGSAPADRTFKPNPESEIPGQAMNPNIEKSTWTNAASTITGATSADVHQGIGRPIAGQTSNDVNDAGKARGERSAAGDISVGKMAGTNERGSD